MNQEDFFLKLCADDILLKRNNNLKNTVIVFPNKRPILFIKKYFAQNIDAPIFLPRFTTIQDMLAEANNYVIPEPIVLIYELFLVYKKHIDTQEPFDTFYPWGEMLLGDFDDIDKYKIDAQQLFSNITSLKEYESAFEFLSDEQIMHIQRFWDILATKEKTKAKASFLTIWNVLFKIYAEFAENLSNKNYAYHGLSARKIIESLKQGNAVFPQQKHYIFIGFNALNTCETELFSELQKRSQSSFYWDYDISYINTNFNHEAGYFISKNLSLFPNELSKECFNNFSKKKNISIISTPNNIAQIKQCHSWIHSIKQNDISDSNSAIILADEQLLTPLIHSVPEDIPYNISLGYPIKNTQAFSFFQAILDLQLNQKKGAFYYKNVIQVCESTLLSFDQQKDAQILRDKLASENFVYVSEKYCSTNFNLPYLHTSKTVHEFISYLESCITLTGDNIHVSDIEKSVLYLIYQEIQYLKLILSKHAIPIENTSFIASILKKSLISKNIPIQGEPLSGLQIMGILETRNLDFKNLFILSMNEGMFPRTNVGSSFIPYSIRIGFGMPTIKEQTAIYSYYFYRLIQRAENITLAYSSQIDENGKGEISRYILQLMYDKPSGVEHVKTKNISFSITPQQSSEIIITKRGDTQKRFGEYTKERPLSPSAIDTYLTCKLKYYYKYVRKLKKPDEVKEIPDEADFGNFFHYSLEDLYKQYINKEVTVKHIEAILQNETLIEKTVEANIHKILAEQKHTNSNEGTRKLAKNTVITYIKNILEYDKTRAPFYIIGLEKDEKMEVHLHSQKLWIGGNIDRLENKHGTYTIIDYKTGRHKEPPKSLDELFDPSVKNRNNAILQALFYSYIVSENYNVNPCSELYYTRDLHNTETSQIKIGKEIIAQFSDVKNEYITLLYKTLEELLDMNIPFTQTKLQDNCSYCDFAKICNK